MTSDQTIHGTTSGTRYIHKRQLSCGNTMHNLRNLQLHAYMPTS